MQRHPDPSSPRHRSHGSRSSRSPDSYIRLSPEITRSEASDSVKDEPLASPPLLMPPPATPLEAFRHRLIIRWLRAGHLINYNATPLLAITRLGLFLSKLYSLTRPCWPYMVNPGVGAVLVVLAALDLGFANSDASSNSRHRRAPVRLTSNGLPWTWGLRGTILLAILHLVILWAANYRSSLCVIRNSWAV